MSTELREQGPTRRPWEIYDFGGQVKHYPKTIIVAPTGESICEISGGWPQCTLAENEANAALIVRAVNNHDALVQELEALRSTLLPVLRDHEVRDNKDRTASFVQYALDRIDAALAAAQE